MDCSTNMPISGEDNQSFTPTVSGDYSVTVDLGPCSETTSCTTVMVTGTTDVIEKSISVYPNPTSDLIFVDSEYEITSIEIFDILGKKVGHFNNKQLSVKDLNSSMYILKINIEDYTVIKKIIKE